jgi:hypothetical protein
LRSAEVIAVYSELTGTFVWVLAQMLFITPLPDIPLRIFQASFPNDLVNRPIFLPSE